MKEKNWYDNIYALNDDEDCISSCGDGYHHDDLTPLTADKWWEFAPWQDVDSAPHDGWFLVIENCTGKIQLAKRYLDDEFIDEFNQSIVFKKWLPLPQVI